MAGSNSDSNSSPTSLTAAGKRPEITTNDSLNQSHLASNSHNPSTFISTSSIDDREHDVASPPYRPEASTTSLTGQDLFLNPNHPYSSYPPSPAYRSQANMSDEVHLEGDRHTTGGGDAKWEGELRDTKHKVHYPESIDMEPVPVVSGDAISPAANKANLRLDEIPSSRDFNRSGTNSPADAISLAGTDDEEDESDYDWSGEDDLVDEEAKFEHQMGVKPKRTGWGFKRIVTLLFSSLLGSTLFAGILVTPGILIHFYWYNDNPTSHRKYVEQNVQAWLFWAAANLLLSWYLAVIVDLVPTLATFIIAAAWGHVSEVFKSRVELYNSVKNTFKPVLYAASAWASWVIIFGHIFNLYDTVDTSQSRAGYTQRLYQVVEFLFFFVLVVCAQKMLSHAIAFAFHRTAFKERLDEVQQALKVIEQLRNYRPKHGRQSGRSSGWAWGTPVLEKAGFGFGKSHHKAFSSSRQHSHRSPDDGGYGADADNDYDDRTMVGTSSRKSTFGSTFGLSTKGKNKNKPQSGVPSPSGDHELGVFTSATSPLARSPHSPSPETSRPMTPSTSAPFMLNQTASPATISPSETGRGTPHRYPPGSGINTASPRPSIDNAAAGASETLAAAAKALKSAVLHDARNIGGDADQIDNSRGGAIGLGHVGSSSEAKKLARAIYLKFRPLGQGRTYLLPSDFYPAFPDSTTAQAAFRVFDKDNNGDLSRAEIKTTLLKVYKERRFLARSMRDVGIALQSLDGILLFFALVIIFFISLSVFGVQVGDSISSVYTLGIGASFIFKTSASNAFDAIMFLFVTHPYDTGDRCFIDDEILVVKKMGLFATIFARVDGTETYYFNSQLSSKFITNVRRSGQMYENVTLQIHWRTPIAKLDALEKYLNNWLQTEQNRWFVPSTAIMFQSINFQRYLEVTIGIGHNGTWQDWGLRCARKTAFHAAVQHYTRQLGILCYESTQPIVYSNASDSPAINVFNDSTMPPPPSPGGYGGWSGSGGYEVEPGPDGGVDIVYGGSGSGAGVDDRNNISPAAAAALGAGEKESGLKTALGFTPPEGLVGSHLRARKTKSRKVMVGLAGDG
ncbi:Mechanosensitive ion channel-domain-containing protein [Lentinula aciculospora]|uniref:Mechanosensitive ion channel-domain-containing protein n=1 Tax=Lentinula aciculospora TaxID=153920 RepID=A0A9W9DJI3_9AGAR|nr:Mechanosensitive ion channel-domain-containing protein [Lentinula aciculospora]